MRAMGAEDAAKEVVQEEAVIRDATVEADASTAQYTYNPSETSRGAFTILDHS